jgi:parvulin-like peptidyl-prolyl isomerase
MRRAFLYVAVLMSVMPLAYSPGTGEKVVAEGIAAQVNGNYVTIGDVLQVLQPLQRQLASRYSGAELNAQVKIAFSNALNSLVERRLILDAYEKQENKFLDAYLENRVNELTQDMFSGDRGDLATALAKEKINLEEWRKEMKEHVIAGTMRRMHVDQNINVSAMAVRRAYDENRERYAKLATVKLRMIAVSNDEPGRKKAAEARSKIEGGADFGEIAKAVSSGSKAADGGDWGWIQPDKLRPELVGKVMSMKKSELSQVIEVEDQLYILKVEDKKETFADFQPQIETELRKIEADRLYAAWIERLRKNAYVKVFDSGIF